MKRRDPLEKLKIYEKFFEREIEVLTRTRDQKYNPETGRFEPRNELSPCSMDRAFLDGRLIELESARDEFYKLFPGIRKK